MADITRPIKTFGTDNYTTEVTANAPNATIIKAGEVDADLNRLYGTINNLDDANIAVGANIHGSKIADGTLPAAKLVPGSITGTQIGSIDGAKLIDNTVNGSKLINNTVPGAKIVADSITARELALFAIVRQVVTAFPVQGLSFSTTETPVVSFPNVTLQPSSHVVIFGTWNTILFALASGAFPAVTVKAYRTATPIYEVTSSIAISAVGESSHAIPFPAPFLYDTVPAGGTFHYQINMFTSSTNLQVQNPGLNVGMFVLMEFIGSIG